MLPARRLTRGRILAALAAILLLALAACNGASTSTKAHTATATFTRAAATPTSLPTGRYTAHLLLHGSQRPDDLAFDVQGRLLFSDYYAGTVSRLNADGSVTVLLRGLAGPEGLVVLSDGTLIIAEQRTNRVLSLAPGAASPTVIRDLPGTNSGATCKEGVDGIALDPTNTTLIVPDSPTGDVYRMSVDGRTLTKIASGIVRPVGAVVDGQGNVYVADECGGAVVHITPAGAITRIGGFSMPDDVAFDPQGGQLVIDLGPSAHALIRVDLQSGQRETLAATGFIEPQGLAVDAHGDVFVSDDAANRIIEFMPA
jgi:sugar lactone lactonase YvrE